MIFNISNIKYYYMGFDIYGLDPKEEDGSYFRANCWYWRPLWSYVISITIDLTIDERMAGSDNSGNQISKEVAEKIGRNILAEKESGFLKDYYQERKDYLENLPKESCYKCVEKDGKKDSDCHVCDGTGNRESMEASYPFSDELAIKFANFCLNSGGFEIC